MKVTRKLLHAEWSFDDETGLITATVFDQMGIGQGSITLGRQYAFSLARFLIRVFQRFSMKRRKKAVHEVEEEVNLENVE
jgi:hypothetical protein